RSTSGESARTAASRGRCDECHRRQSMTEIPEHLRKRAEEARKKAAEKSGAAGATSGGEPAADGGAEEPAQSEAASRIPAHLLERSRAARAGGVATAAPPIAAGPGGHTQRLLTVVKSGSIQDVRAEPVDKVHVWPH